MSDFIKYQHGFYYILQPLGGDDIVHVYLAEHHLTRERVVLKILNSQLRDHDDRFLDTARVMARLDHSHIIRLLDFGEQGIGERHQMFLTITYAPRGSARLRYRQGVRAPLKMVVAHVQQIAEALQFAHAQGIIHQRVKPENILFGADDEILLSDFGFAWRFDAPQSMTSDPPVSEVAYLAPEQLMGQPQETSDQYALGAIVYEWLSGAPLFGGSAAEIARQQREMPPPPLRDRVADLSPLVEEVVMIALAKDPARRFRMIRGFATALEQAARDQATEGS